MYRIVPDESVLDQVAQLPAEALAPFVEVIDVLELTPWNGEPQHRGNPTAEVRRWHFGSGSSGQVVYLIVERRREVHVLLVQWLG